MERAALHRNINTAYQKQGYIRFILLHQLIMESLLHHVVQYLLSSGNLGLGHLGLELDSRKQELGYSANVWPNHLLKGLQTIYALMPHARSTSSRD